MQAFGAVDARYQGFGWFVRNGSVLGNSRRKLLSFSVLGLEMQAQATTSRTGTTYFSKLKVSNCIFHSFNREIYHD